MAKFKTSFWTADSLAHGNSSHCFEISIMLDLTTSGPSAGSSIVLADKVVHIDGVWDQVLLGIVTSDGSKIHSGLIDQEHHPC